MNIASAPSSSPSHRWRCSLCSLEMRVNHKDHHLVGKKHRKKQQEIAASNAQVEHRTGLAVVMPLPSSTLPTHQWRCSLCSLEMLIKHKDHHLVGKKHRKKQQEIAASNAQVEHRTGLAVVAPSTLPTHLSTGGSSLGIPSVKPSGNLPQALPKSGHRKRQRRPKRSPSPNPSTRRDSHSSYDSEDLRGLLYDIDTAFGCRPQGGAYKESNHYSKDGFEIC